MHVAPLELQRVREIAPRGHLRQRRQQRLGAPTARQLCQVQALGWHAPDAHHGSLPHSLAAHNEGQPRGRERLPLHVPGLQ